MRAAAAGALAVRPVADRAELMAFIRLPNALYAGAEGFSAPLEFERLETHDPKRQPFFQHGRAQYFIAYRGGRPVGRIAAVFDEWAQKAHGANTGFFGFFDCADDRDAAKALFDAAEHWLRPLGVKEIRGPFSHSINEETGLLIDGFDSPPVLMMPFHPPYLGALVEAQGFAKVMDVEAYDYRVGNAGFRKRVESAARQGVVIRALKSDDYASEIATIVDIFNDAWARNWGFVPFAENEVAHLAASLKPVLVPELVLFAEIDGKPVAMAVCLPNVAAIAKDFGGKLLPFNWVKLLLGLRKGGVDSARVPLMGLRRAYQNSLAGTATLLGLFATLDAAMAARGIERVELSWILETNDPMQRLLRVLGAEKYKTYRIYSKSLAA